MEVSEQILLIKTDNSVLIDVEVEEMIELEDVFSLVSNSKEKEKEASVVERGGGAALSADQVAVQLERLLEELAWQGEHVTMWRRSRGLEGGGGTWHRVAVRENGHGTLISKGW